MDHRKHFPTFIGYGAAAGAWYAGASWWQKFFVNFIATAAVVWLLYFLFVAPPSDFPQGAYITVSSGESLTAIATDFKSRGLISSTRLFTSAARVLGNDKHIPAGVYYFPRPINLVSVAIRVVTGDFETTPVKVRVVEGATVDDIAATLTKNMPNFDRRGFLAATTGKEGYLFPDTYFFMPGDSVQSILSVFNNGLQSHLNKIKPQLTAFNKPLPEVLTMASLLEKEASDTQSRRIIAGILWHRIAIGMPLQVDAVFPYILHKSALDLTKDDLKVDSPYNTYINKGLPPGPIANPGLDSITAAVTPIKSNYLYYLSDKQGNFHYAATYAQHVANIKKYLSS